MLAMIGRWVQREINRFRQRLILKRAGVVELADALRSGRSGLYARASSSLASGTNLPLFLKHMK